MDTQAAIARETAPAAPDSRTALHALFLDLEATLERRDMGRFLKLLADRHTLLQRWRNERGLTTLPADAIDNLVSQNRRWQGILRDRCASIQRELTRDRSRKNACRALGRAYGGGHSNACCVAGSG